MSKDPKTRALEVCLQRVAVGDEIEQTLRAYPRWAHELRPLLQAAKSAQELAESIQVPEEAQRNSQHAYLEAASQIIPKTSTQRHRRRWRQALLLVIALVVFTMIALQTVSLSSQALPGDLLYTLKLNLESFQLSMTNNLDERLTLEMEQDRERVREVQRLLEQGSVQNVKFSAGLQDKANGEWLVGELSVKILANTRLVGEITPGYAITVEGETTPEGEILARQVQMREFLLSGQFQEISSNQWSVDGVLVIISPKTVLRDSPQSGKQVNVIALLSLDNLLRARLVNVEQPQAEE